MRPSASVAPGHVTFVFIDSPSRMYDEFVLFVPAAADAEAAFDDEPPPAADDEWRKLDEPPPKYI